MKEAKQQEENSVTRLNTKVSLPLVLSMNQVLSGGPVGVGGRERRRGGGRRKGMSCHHPWRTAH